MTSATCPIRIRRQDGELIVEWIDTGGRRFTDPFFEDTIRRIKADGGRTYSTPVADLALRPASALRAPTGLIFHISRCGSTLVSQMLAASTEDLVISEAPTIDDVLRSGLGKAELIELLRSTVSALGDLAVNGEKYFFIKLDSWHILSIDVFQEAFPGVPSVFIFREPAEVIASHLRQRGMQMVPGLKDDILPDVSAAEQAMMPPEEYCARVLERFCDAALENASDLMLVNYTELPDAVFTNMSRHFKVQFDADDIEAMRLVSARDAKAPSLAFEPRNDEIPAAVKSAAATFVGRQYEELCRIAEAK